MYQIGYTNRFKKDLKRCFKRGFDLSILEKAVDLLQQEGTLPQKYKAHKLSGNYSDCWECHLQPNWLLIWKQNDEEFILLFINTGSHSDLF